jgi:hypothetical protein
MNRKDRDPIPLLCLRAKASHELLNHSRIDVKNTHANRRALSDLWLANLGLRRLSEHLHPIWRVVMTLSTPLCCKYKVVVAGQFNTMTYQMDLMII